MDDESSAGAGLIVATALARGVRAGRAPPSTIGLPRAASARLEASWGAWGDKDGQDVMSGIDAVIKAYPIDPARVGHTGHSYGGFMTNWLITQYPDRFAAAVSGAGISNWISDYGTGDIYRTKETEFSARHGTMAHARG